MILRSPAVQNNKEARGMIGRKPGASGDYLTMARMRTESAPGFLLLAGATMTSEPVAGSAVKRAVP